MEEIAIPLNSRQKEAVEKFNGPSVILAGAGSGKTRTLIAKVRYLIENKGIDPKKILMITFTNKAAEEMKERIGARKVGFVGTFHSFSSRILRIEAEKAGLKKNFAIYDEVDQKVLVKSIIEEKYEKRYTPGFFLNRISGAKNQMITPIDYLGLFSGTPTGKDTGKVYLEYNRRLKENNAVDFDDLLIHAVLLFKKEKEVITKYQEMYRYILIDEFQDTNKVQYELVRLLGRKYGNITVVGDFSQSIYSWRGAQIENLNRFKDDFPGTQTFMLEQNYRSSQTILDFAYEIISKNTSHPILKLFTKEKAGEEITFFEAENEEDEALYIASMLKNRQDLFPYNKNAVLYRTNAQSRAIEEAFLHLGLPYRLIGGVRFYERKEIKDVIAMLRIFINPQDKVSAERIIKLGKRKWKKYQEFMEKNKNAVNKKTDELIDEVLKATDYMEAFNPENEKDYSRMENIKELKSVSLSFPVLDQFLEQVALVESEYFAGEKKALKEGVKLMTIHQAKGLEFYSVYVIGVEEGIIPHIRSIEDDLNIEEERRLFYVAVTRAKKKLTITWAKRRYLYGRSNGGRKSRFLEDAGY